MAEYNVIRVGSLPTATQPQIDGGQIIVVFGQNAFKASSASMKGKEGDKIEVRNNGTNIQWRYSTQSTWNNLVAIADLKGNNAANPIMTFDITMLPFGSTPTSSVSGTYPNLMLHLGIPSGKQGDKADNPNFDFEITAISPNATPTVSVSGIYPDLTIHLGIPRGRKGDKGDTPEVDFEIDYDTGELIMITED